MRKKVIDIILVVIWMATIFVFSNQPSEISGETSGNLARNILTTTKIIDRIPEDKQEEIIEHFDKVIRKIAHYTIYTVGGILIFNFVNIFNINEKRKLAYSFLFGAFYAGTDEIHQYFVEGRACMWQDVCLDSLGVLTGIVFFMIVFNIVDKIKFQSKLKSA